MLWAISLLLLMAWFLTLIGGIGGGLAWAAFVIAALLLAFRLVGGRRAI